MLKKPITAIDALLNAAQRISLYLAEVAGLLLLIAIAIITINVISLAVFTSVLLPASELSGYILAASVTIALSHAQLKKAHIRIDAMYNLLTPSYRRILDILSLISFLVFGIIMTIAAWEVAEESFIRHSLSNTPLQVPLWIPQFAWVAGLVWFCVVLSLVLIRSLLALADKDLATIEQLASNQDEAALLGEEA